MFLAAASRDDGSARYGLHPSGATDDDDLVRRVRDGISDEARDALGTLFARYAPRLLRYAQVQLGSTSAAEDLVQELFLALWAGRRTWVVRGALAPYLFQAVRNRTQNARRDAAVRARIGTTSSDETMLSAATPAGSDDLLRERELQQVADRAIAALPPRAREAYELVKGAGLSHADAARVMGVSTDALVGHLRRALQGLREALAAYFDAE